MQYTRTPPAEFFDEADSLPWLGQEHCGIGDAIRSVEQVDGTSIFTFGCRIGAPVIREMPARKVLAAAKKAPIAGRPDRYLSNR